MVGVAAVGAVRRLATRINPNRL